MSARVSAQARRLTLDLELEILELFEKLEQVCPPRPRWDFLYFWVHDARYPLKLREGKPRH